MNKSEKLFLKQARLGYSNLLHKYYRRSPNEILSNRKQLQNEKFVFSDVNIKRLGDINSLLSQRGKVAYENAEKLESQVLELMRNPLSFISDYEIEFLVAFFAEQKYSHIPDLQGNPFFEWKPMRFVKCTEIEQRIEREKDKAWLFKEDHRETISAFQPLSGFCHCYLFHDLIYHTILSYQDIVDIEDVWIEVILTVQNHQEIAVFE